MKVPRYTEHAKLLLALADGPRETADVAESLDISPDHARQMLTSMLREGLVRQQYRIAARQGVPIVWELAR